MKVLVTGGSGYIGSHICVCLLAAGHEVVVVDSLINSDETVMGRIEKISGKRPAFFHLDIREREKLAAVFAAHRIDAVIHLAGLKAVGESVEKPLAYYDNNVHGAVTLFEVMEAHQVFTLVFSSSATVYGNPATVPVQETFPLQATNPYGRTKIFIEEILQDLRASNSKWNIASLRYFNPVGAHPSGLIGENPNGIPNNLMPFVARVASGTLKEVSVFGNDYPTIDGTGVRDYIHVVDLAEGHLKSLEKLTSKPGLVAYNLGTGKGHSVLELIQAFERACGKKIPYKFVSRRAGDVASSFADPTRAKAELGWVAQKSLEDMCADTWRWQASL